MKKWFFWSAMCAVSILNGGCFLGASLNVMRQGIDGADNQAALLFIPMLWIMAVFVLIALNIYTLICGIGIRKEQVIHFLDIFRLSQCSPKEKLGRIAFFAAACLLVLFGYSLFAPDMWAAAYGLSGGALLLSLYAWKQETVRSAGQ